MTEIQYQPSRSVKLYSRLRYEQNQKNAPGHLEHYDYLNTVIHRQFRIHAQYSHIPQPHFSNQGRIQLFQE